MFSGYYDWYLSAEIRGNRTIAVYRNSCPFESFTQELGVTMSSVDNR